ncbi:U6 snRNP-associated protein Lsm7 [Taphrina deformans PYCC 5710]|uniref:U6 snRNP-associated protein Lsm7 n=1 Tax=Taphrina deformans (strain PYCC 5710 / ATCC 11124 / CBS 356.35 / IMI 108563 / JCM 9778 / NBRC 8474) TaxID=1097556 RepID=R4XAB4_TAPDE|nr:U6 snRNP-associated protein Lsm7 [Taphrina deformans PYCC 5710]|eukprot:CCG82697.1 U6 snRNP-associated protein Lsm7 [Taphrina deformans PYCC 5710]
MSSRGAQNNRGGRGGRGRGGAQSGSDRPKKEAILDLAKYQDKQVRVKFTGGREIVGILKGHDQLMNLVLDEVREQLRNDEGTILDETRELGLVVVRGPTLVMITPVDGAEEIANPFIQAE